MNSSRVGTAWDAFTKSLYARLGAAVGVCSLTLILAIWSWGRGAVDHVVEHSPTFQRIEARQDSTDSIVARLQREQTASRTQQENFVVAQMLTNPALARELEQMANAKDSGRARETAARDVYRRLGK